MLCYGFKIAYKMTRVVGLLVRDVPTHPRDHGSNLNNLIRRDNTNFLSAGDTNCKTIG